MMMKISTSPRAITIQVQYEHGQRVWLKARGSEGEAREGIVIYYNVDPHMTVLYEIGWADGTTDTHYAIEITDEKPQEWEKG